MAFLTVKGLLLLLGIKWVTKAYNSLSSRFARGKQESVHTCTRIILQGEPSQMLSMLPSPFCITKNWDNAQGDFGCALTLPRQIFLKLERIFLLVGISWVFSQCPLAALVSRLESRFKLLQVHRCHRVQYICSPAQ